jgi:hypothetical protein
MPTLRQHTATPEAQFRLLIDQLLDDVLIIYIYSNGFLMDRHTTDFG